MHVGFLNVIRSIFATVPCMTITLQRSAQKASKSCTPVYVLTVE